MGVTDGLILKELQQIRRVLEAQVALQQEVNRLLYRLAAGDDPSAPPSTPTFTPPPIPHTKRGLRRTSGSPSAD